MQYVFLLAVVSVVFTAAPAGRPGNSAPATANVKSAAELYAKYCASCHGKDGQAKTFKAKFNHARNLTESTWQQEVSDERVFNSIMNGKRKMPAFGKKFSEPEIDALVAYVRSLKR
jgi:mono/diheme cytochrome c family protein